LFLSSKTFPILTELNKKSFHFFLKNILSKGIESLPHTWIRNPNIFATIVDLRYFKHQRLFFQVAKIQGLEHLSLWQNLEILFANFYGLFCVKGF